MRIIAVTAVLIVLVSARAAQSQPKVDVPLSIDYATLSEELKRSVYADNGRAQLWNGSDLCQYLYAEHPSFSRAGGRLKLETDGTLSIGVAVGSACLSPIQWNGIIETESEPYVAGKVLKLRVTDINLLDHQHRKTLIAGKGFDLIKQYFIPRIETFEFDLDPVTAQLRDLADVASPPDVADRVKATLATLRVLPEVDVLDDGIRAKVELTMPVFPTPGLAAAATPNAAAITPAEMSAFQTHLDQWDAFLVFAIKQLGVADNDPQFRADLFELLLDSRYRLVRALEHPEAGGPDPVRILFIDQWDRLGEIIRAAAHRGTLGNRSLEFLGFISAGDALFALDQASPALGMRVSADDLRRLAHIMAPRASGDPLEFNFDEDPELRKLFGTKMPLESEGPLEAGPDETPSPASIQTPAETASPGATQGAAPVRSPGAVAATAAASAGPVETPEPVMTPAMPAGASAAAPVPSPSDDDDSSPGSMLDLLRWALIPVPAEAAQVTQSAKAPDVVRKLQVLGGKLKRVVVSDRNADQYRGDLDQLLELDGQYEMNEQDIDPAHRNLYARLVKAVAWQESCWRQFRLRGGRVVYLESSTQDLGLMQVNKHVWRGFYSLQRLEWDIIYNAGAGMEILAQMLENDQNKRGAASPGRPDDLARSAYASYNGGPGAYRRWRGREPREERLIDDAFWQKFQAVSRGQTIDILSCAADWDQGH